MSVTTDGIPGNNNSPLILTTITSPAGYNVIQMNDDQGNGWQMGVPGSGNSDTRFAGYYLYDVRTANPYFSVAKTTDTVTLHPINGVFHVTSDSTNSTEIELSNSTSGGHDIHIGLGGSAQSGQMVVYDDAYQSGGEPLAQDDSGSGVFKVTSIGMFGWASSSQYANSPADTALQRSAAGSVNVVNVPAMTWGTLGVDNLKLGGDPPQCKSNNTSAFMRTSDGKPGWCSSDLGKTLHTLSFVN
jgi:hypothetical protein